MPSKQVSPSWEILRVFFRPHPWHGISIGDCTPEKVTAFIEIVPTDTVKYELEKTTGHMKLDRPQKFSNICPTPYGFIPQTYCGERVAALSEERTGRTSLIGDGDPLDICVLTDRTLSRADFSLEAIPIGGLRMMDGGEVDDKIIAVLENDTSYGHFQDIRDCPSAFVERIIHYFLTYKQSRAESAQATEVTHIYGREESHEVIRRSCEDYATRFSSLAELLETTLSRAT
jgi:inorganic pyrophosphatase